LLYRAARDSLPRITSVRSKKVVALIVTATRPCPASEGAVRNLGHDATGRDVETKGPCCRLIRVIFGMAFKTSCAICSWFKFAAVTTKDVGVQDGL